MVKIRLNEFLEKLEIKRKRSGEENLYIHVGNQNEEGGVAIGNYYIKTQASMGDRLVYEIHVITT